MSVHVRFLLDAECSPGLLPRVLQPFAKRDLTPDRMWSHSTGDTMHIEIAVEAMPNEEIHLVEGNLRQIVGVRQVIQVRPEPRRQATSRGKIRLASDSDRTSGQSIEAMAGTA